ncbi:hypothetical protein BG003_008174 [Podila horticola]|nr:hypothetical protein BG003_008174 [Podila horticola]
MIVDYFDEWTLKLDDDKEDFPNMDASSTDTNEEILTMMDPLKLYNTIDEMQGGDHIKINSLKLYDSNNDIMSMDIFQMLKDSKEQNQAGLHLYQQAGEQADAGLPKLVLGPWNLNMDFNGLSPHNGEDDCHMLLSK